MSTKRIVGGILAAVGFLASIIVANWLTTVYGFVPVGFGLAATAGTFAAGFALALRDATQDSLGKWPVVATVLLGAGISYLIADPFIATASAVAFLLSELADFAVYTPLRRKSWAGAVVASNAVGAVLDTVVFIGIAFGAAMILPSLLGQLVGKAWATGLYLVIGGVARAVLREPVHATNS